MPKPFLSAALLLALCLPTGAQAPAQISAPDAPQPPRHGLFLSAMDTRVKPCDDFYEYANGKWLTAAAIPPERSGAGVGLEVSDRNQFILRAIAEKAAATHADPNSPAGKVGSFYRSGMDEARIEADGA